MAILAPEAYQTFSTSLGGSDALRIVASKRPVLPSWTLLPPEVQDGFTAALVGPPADGEAMYALYLASVDAADPIPATILGNTDVVTPLWAALSATVQAAWDATAVAAQ